MKLEEKVGELLKAKKLSLSTAESCTGGGIAALITSVPGSSEYFNGSIVAYSNEIKMSLLHVRSEEHTSELQSLASISYAVFCLKKIFFNDTATTEIYTLSLHDALPILTSTCKKEYNFPQSTLRCRPSHGKVFLNGTMQ